MDNDVSQLIHDIRNPLNTISINAELGKLTLSRTGDIEKATQAYDVIISECRRCSEQLEKLREHLDGQTLDGQAPAKPSEIDYE